MKNPFVCRIGGVVSADIAVPEHDREVAFYSSILTTGRDPLWREDLMNNHGTAIIGLGARTAEYESLPLQWMPHFQVADVAASVAEAVQLGGKILIQSNPESEEYQWAGIADPSGAAFGIIPTAAEGSYEKEETVRSGCIAWLSLAVTDAVAIRSFYEQVIGWKSTSTPKNQGSLPGSGFEMLIDDNISAAEIHQPPQELPEIPSVWLLHLPVDDLEESVRRAGDGGGQVIARTTSRAVIRDPVGVYVALQSSTD